MQVKYISALEVKDGDVIYTEGFRVRVSSVTKHHGGTVAQYVLNSEPNERNPNRLPVGYEGMDSGGNQSARVAVELSDDEPFRLESQTVPRPSGSGPSFPANTKPDGSPLSQMVLFTGSQSCLPGQRDLFELVPESQPCR